MLCLMMLQEHIVTRITMTSIAMCRYCPERLGNRRLAGDRYLPPIFICAEKTRSGGRWSHRQLPDTASKRRNIIPLSCPKLLLTWRTLGGALGGDRRSRRVLQQWRMYRTLFFGLCIAI